MQMEKLIVHIIKNKLEITYHGALLLIMNKYNKAQKTTCAMLRLLMQVLFYKKNKLRVFFR